MDPEALAGEGVDPSLLPLDELADCAAAALAADGARILSYGAGAGYTPLRELIAEWFDVHPGRVVLTNGSLQALDLVARRFAYGRDVVAEYPVYERAEKALLAAGATLTSVSVDREGMNVAELKQMLTEYRRPSLVYTIPSFHNPTGSTMTVERRRLLVETVTAQNRLQMVPVIVVEDDAYGLTRFEGERLPALFDISREPTIFVGSFSASIAPGLRVGWLVLPEEYAGELAADATSTYISPALVGQATVFEFIQRGGLEPHLHRLRSGLRERRDALVEALAAHFPDGTWTLPEGGFHLWLELPMGNDSRVFVPRSQVATAVPGTEFAWTANAIRFSFAAVSADEVAAGVERVATARIEEAA